MHLNRKYREPTRRDDGARTGGARVARVTVSALGLALAGCEHVSGVEREAPITFVPAPAVVAALVRGAPGVDSVEVRVDSGAGARVVHTFVYRGGSDVLGVLQLSSGGAGGARYSDNLSRFSGAPPQREVDATLPVMRAIEARLEARAGLAGLGAAVVQRCTDVRCAP